MNRVTEKFPLLNHSRSCIMAHVTGLFFLAAIVALFSAGTAAPTKLDNMENLEFLAHALSQDLSSVPDPGIGDWFNRNAKIVLPKISELFKDPSNIKKFSELFKPYRDFIEPGIKFLEKYYSDETATMNIVHVVKSFLDAIDKMSDGSIKTNVS